MSALRDIFAKIIGEDHVLGPERLQGRNPGYCAESLGAGLLLRPGTAGELALICKAATQHGIGLVPQGGLTGLVDATASHPGEAIVSFERMNRILRLDPMQGIAEVEPGVTLAALAAAAEPHGMMPGVDIPSRGSCTIGGMVSTNAGGVRVLQYGMMRQNVLGLEVVLADGRILDLTSPLIKNNAGYDMKQVFIGSEGTLGLVSRVVVKLWPALTGTSCALLACDAPGQLPVLFARARAALGTALTSFEAMWPDYYRLTISRPGYGRPPLDPDHGIYAVIEVGGKSSEAAQETLLAFMETAFEEGVIRDATVARSEADRAAIWRAREDSDAIVQGFPANLSYDVGLQLRDLDPFADRLVARFAAAFPGVVPYIFGHIGDGNLHVMFGLSAEQFAGRDAFDRLIYGTVAEFPGSTISAEHGIGLEKRAYLGAAVGEETLEAMRALKRSFDPDGILNPGKVFTL